MKHILKYVEWEDGWGNWYCNDTSDLVGSASVWDTPAKMLNLSPSAYVEMLITKFKPDRVAFDQESKVLVYSWKNQVAMRKFKNWINAEARKHQFFV